MASILFAIGGAIIALLGALHGLYTWRDERHPKLLAPQDPALVETMRTARLGLTAQTDLWRAWIGFNYSHALGAMIFGGSVLVVALTAPDALAMPALRFGAPVIAALYLTLSIRYWFSIPTTGIAIALGLMSLGAALTAGPA
ncbi:MAG: hypothetical protein AAFV19_02865 [Pseudomonadota bacterium]